jgi:anhydro-N-acetylmuramic acid kinase
VIVAGVMSGTSADGINVAIVRISSPNAGAKKSSSQYPRFEILAHSEYAYPKAVRRAVLAAMNSNQASVGDLARLNVLLGELYADAVLATQKKTTRKVELIGCHGQTLFHQGESARYLGKRISASWQTGEGAIVAARVAVPVVTDFRPADMANGGKGAPLVPFLDYVFYRHPKKGRIVQNIGGIANLTAIVPAASPEQIIAFDTGPGNMVIDAVVDQLYGKGYDRDGRLAASGRVLAEILPSLLRAPYFLHPPPKTAGREEFGREFVAEFLRRCRGSRKQDIVATATALTVRSIADALRRFVVRKKGVFEDLIVSGGGAKNPTLLAMLRNEVSESGLRVRLSDDFGLPSDAKEAVAFAVLAFRTWHRQPSNIPAATGARRTAILGKISYV